MIASTTQGLEIKLENKKEVQALQDLIVHGRQHHCKGKGLSKPLEKFSEDLLTMCCAAVEGSSRGMREDRL